MTRLGSVNPRLDQHLQESLRQFSTVSTVGKDFMFLILSPEEMGSRQADGNVDSNITSKITHLGAK